MNTSILEDIGLTNAEIKIYLALLEISPATAGPILKKTQLQNSVVHLNLGKLIEKGLVTYITKGKRRHYQVKDLRSILRFIDEKKEKLEKLLPELLAKQTQVEKQEAEIFEGLQGLKTMAYQFIEDAQSGDEYLYFSFYCKNPDDFNEVYEFYKEFEKDRLRFGLRLKGIVPKNIQEKYVGRKKQYLRFVDIPTLNNISIFRNKIFMTPWEDRQLSFLITSQQLADNFRQYFYSIWNQ